MTDANPTILAPIRYPLTAQSIQTLEHASRLAAEYENAELLVLHVNLFQYDEHATAQEIHEAIAPMLGDQPVTVSVRRGLLVEEVILDEAKDRRVDVIVVGRNQKATWRQFLSRLVGNNPAVETYLRDYANTEVQVVG